MSKKWTDDAVLVGNMAQRLVETLPLFPKRFVRVDELVRQQKMPFSHLQILIMLEEGDLSIGQISARLGIAKPNITPLVDSLRDQGFVERVRDEQDRRIVNVRMLPAGHEKLDEIQRSIVEQVVIWPGEFSRSEMKELNNALASIIRIVQGIGEIDV